MSEFRPRPGYKDEIHTANVFPLLRLCMTKFHSKEVDIVDEMLEELTCCRESFGSGLTLEMRLSKCC